MTICLAMVESIKVIISEENVQSSFVKVFNDISSTSLTEQDSTYHQYTGLSILDLFFFGVDKSGCKHMFYVPNIYAI